MSHYAEIPEVVYTAYPNLPTHPIIAQVFVAGAGWRSTGSYRKRVTGAWCRKLRREGVTVVALEIGPGRLADFSIAELVRRRR